MDGIPSIHIEMAPEPNSPEIWPRWTRGYPPVTTEQDGTLSLHSYGIRFEDDRIRPRFYPLLLLQHLLTEQVLSCEIRALRLVDNPTEQDELVRQVLGLGHSRQESTRGETRTYIKVFAILKVIHRLESLKDFIRHNVSDEDLPLGSNDGQDNAPLFRSGSRERLPDEILDFDGRFMFCKQQYNMIIPFFDRNTQPYDLDGNHVLPYYRPSQTGVFAEFAHSSGGFASVSKILIHPLCHAFHGLFDDIQGPGEEMFFALKELRQNDPEGFQKEVEMLQRFNGAAHDHLVTLLAAFNYRNRRFLIFPWATCDLGRYWELVNPRPARTDARMVRWICYQAWKLVEAVKCIHLSPENDRTPETERQYGRHGDLKPENILWYKENSGFGKLVISDMGLSRTHRFVSRSYVPNRKVPASPKYRPPECDYINGVMSRTFDIWTLGCIFLEMLCWLLGDFELLQQMEDERMTPSIRGQDSDEYFEWVYVQDLGWYTIRLKTAVTQVSSLRINPLVP
ncbi:kinase-like domain-containing protein, partial [Xylariaceae sp. AK1471]